MEEMEMLWRMSKEQISRPPPKWAPRPLVTSCGVCSSPATDVQHYGSITCFSCRAFFRRSVGTNKKYSICSRGTDNCVIDPVNRTNCKKCRFNKCLKIGMKPEKVDRFKAEYRGGRKTSLSALQVNNSINNIERVNNTLNLQERSTTSHLNHPNTNATNNPPLISDSLARSSTAGKDDLNGNSGFQTDYLQQQDALASTNSVQSDSGNNGTGRKSTNTRMVVIEPRVCHSSLSISAIAPNHRDSFSTIPPTIESGLTLEEEFRIHELMVRKECMFDQSFALGMGHDRFKTQLKKFLSTIRLNKSDVSRMEPPEIFNLLFNPKVWFDYFFNHNGLFDRDLAGVDMKTKAESLAFVLPILQICTRAYIHSNKDKSDFWSQMAASGTLYNSFKTFYKEALNISDDKELFLPSFDPLTLSIFKSPWAADWEDEVHFSSTVSKVGAAVKDDLKLGALYFFLILFTPKENNMAHPQMLRVKNELSLLIFRYLKFKQGNSETANNSANNLNRLIYNLHECREIHVNRRIFRDINWFPDCETILTSVNPLESP